MSGRSCELCGDTASVRVQLAWYRSEVAHRLGMPEVQTAARCMDHDACRVRCLANGDEWPLLTSYPERDFPLDPPVPVATVASNTTNAEPEQGPKEGTSWFS